nr:hypothetical protein KitaXyl93_47150 [Kitasatospora sp. Xyl93]
MKRGCEGPPGDLRALRLGLRVAEHRQGHRYGSSCTTSEATIAVTARDSWRRERRMSGSFRRADTPRKECRTRGSGRARSRPGRLLARVGRYHRRVNLYWHVVLPPLSA